MLLYHLLRTLSLVPCCYFCCPITEPDSETINQFITRKLLSTFLSKCPLMMTWLAVTRSLQLDMANLVTTQDLLFRSHTLSVLSWLPLTTRVVSPINLADNTLPECPSYYVLHICVLINPNQLSPGQKCPGDNFFFNALFVSEHFKHFEIYLFLTHFGG